MAENQQPVPELLYHTLLKVIVEHPATGGNIQTAYPLGTHTNLDTAKQFANKALQTLGYVPSDFAEYEVRSASHPAVWKHGDGTAVYAKSHDGGTEFVIGLATTANNLQLAAGPDDVPTLPKGVDHLQYVIQTKIDYNRDRSGAVQATDVEAVFLHRADALAAAKACLVAEGTEYAQYDVRDSAEMGGEWPFGEDVVVHAVANTGENFTVAIRTVPGAHHRHAKTTKSSKE